MATERHDNSIQWTSLRAAAAKAPVTAVRNLALGSIAVSLMTLALLGWLVFTLAR
jgi:hypothetical protein